MLIKLRKGKRAQSLVIVALSATALFGIIALGLDAGRLYFQRRDVQNAADAGALAGAQELIPSQVTPIPTTAMITAAGCQASVYALQVLLDTPKDGGCTPTPSGAYQPPSLGAGITEQAQNISATVQVWTPSRNNYNEIHVRVTYNVPLTFASVLGFTTSAVVADAFAHGGFYNRTYTVFGFDAGGNGNSVNYDQNGNTQVDNGNNGQDFCRPAGAQGKMVSNAKWHAPNPGGGWMDLNGQFYYAQASDTHALTLYWYSSVTTAQGLEPIPNYEAPLKPGTLNPSYGIINPGGRDIHIIYPGTYTHNINIPSDFGGSAGGDIFRFMNGIYYFQDASLNISGGTVSNTLSGGPKFGPYGGVSDLGAAPDGTNGVEFVFDGNASFNATTSGATSPSVFFAAPSFVSSGTDSIVFFVKSTDSISGPTGTPIVEQIDGTKPTAGGYPFQIWGSIFNADVNGSHGTGVVIQAVSKSVYAVNGEVVSPQADLDGGNLVNGAYVPSTYPGACPGSPSGYVQNQAGYLVQFNPHYVPHWRGLAYLVK
jgi:Flp pilus assembly protein TadG